MSVHVHLDQVLDSDLEAKVRARALFNLLNEIDEPVLGEILMTLKDEDPQRYDVLLKFSSDFSALLDLAETTWGAKE